MKKIIIILSILILVFPHNIIAMEISPNMSADCPYQNVNYGKWQYYAASTTSAAYQYKGNKYYSSIKLTKSKVPPISTSTSYKAVIGKAAARAASLDKRFEYVQLNTTDIDHDKYYYITSAVYAIPYQKKYSSAPGGCKAGMGEVTYKRDDNDNTYYFFTISKPSSGAKVVENGTKIVYVGKRL